MKRLLGQLCDCTDTSATVKLEKCVTLTAHEHPPMTPLLHAPMRLGSWVMSVMSEMANICVLARIKSHNAGSRFACSSRMGMSRIMPPTISTAAEGWI